MGKINTITFELEGLTDLIFNNFTVGVKDSSMRKPDLGTNLTDDERKEIILHKGHFYNGNPVIPAINLRKSMERVASLVQLKGKTTMKGAIQQNLLDITERYLTIAPQKEYEVRWDRVNVGGKQGSQMIIARPVLKTPWSTRVTMEYFPPVTEDKVIETIQRAGRQGIGAYKILFGQFAPKRIEPERQAI